MSGTLASLRSRRCWSGSRRSVYPPSARAETRPKPAPLILERHGIRVALLGYNGFKPRSFEAGPDSPGVAWCIEDQMVADVRAARARADVVIPFLHLGDEYEPRPNDQQRRFAHALIDAGAAAVVGGHPHVTQGVATYKHRPIVYSLGNFVFDDFNDEHDSKEAEACRLGWILRLTLDRHGVTTWDTVVTRTDDRGFPQIVPRTADARDNGSKTLPAPMTPASR